MFCISCVCDVRDVRVEYGGACGAWAGAWARWPAGVACSVAIMGVFNICYKPSLQAPNPPAKEKKKAKAKKA